MYMSWMRIAHERRLTESSNSENEATLKQQCSVLTDIYYSCFVNGVYQSIQQDLFVHKHDVDAAINNICEESLAIETDITTYLLSSCQHLQRIVEVAHAESENQIESIQSEEEDFHPRRQSVRFSDYIEEMDAEEYDTPFIPRELQFPRAMAKLKVMLNHPCEFTPGSHDLVKDKFSDIVQKWFKPVPTNPDYYIYSPVTVPVSDSGDDIEDRNQSDNNTGVLDLSQQDYDDLTFFDDDDMVVVGKKTIDQEVLSTASQLDSEDSYTEEDLMEDEKESENIPLFVFFTSSITYRQDMENVTVQGLIPCLDEILSKIDVDMEVTLDDFKITFDINCVTMATDEAEEPKMTYMRMLSNTSAGSSPPDSPRDDIIPAASSTDIGTIKPSDPIKHLPRQQHLAITKCKEELEWLLRDEIASSLRHLNLHKSIQSDTLQYVTEHIRQSTEIGKPNCSFETIPLHFVYGVEKSLPKFQEELERINFHKYKLIKEEDFYFVITNKTVVSLSKALTSALVELSRETTPATVDLLASNSQESQTCVTYVSPTLMTTKERKMQSPISPGNKEGKSPIFSGDKLVASPKIEEEKAGDEDPLEEYTDFYQKLEGVSNMRSAKSGDIRSLSAGEIEVQGLKKSSSCAGLLMTTSPKGTDHSKAPVNTLTTVPLMSLPGRPRHFSAPSGQGTPRSKASTIDYTPSWGASRASLTEAGYEGDSSDSEEDETGFNDLSGSVQQPVPAFWLIMKVISKVKEQGVEVYFHSRETGQEDTEDKLEQRGLVAHVKESVDKLCCKVNQLLLLNDLYETRVCRNLLVPEADEDVKWAVGSYYPRSVSSMNKGSEDGSEEDEEESLDQQYLYDSLKWDGGHFDCDCVFSKTFFLHSRLKTVSGHRTLTTDIGLTALKSVLQKFSVINRKNMFVIMESTSQAVFYLRLKEISGKDMFIQRQISIISTNSVEDINLADSTGSFMSGMKKDDQLSVPEKDSDSLSIGSTSSMMTSHKSQDAIELYVHGIEEPGAEIKEGLVNTLQNKLDDAVLDILYVQFKRNPLSKLSAEDVRFIQKPSDIIIKPNPDMKGTMQIQLTISMAAMMQLSALMYYLKQNLKLFCHIPNYAETRPEGQFQDVLDNKQQAITDGHAFLYIRPSHGKGIACISLALVDGQGSLVHVLACPKPSRMSYTKITTERDFEQNVQTEFYQHSSPGPGPTALLQFRAWEVGSVDLAALKEKLLQAVRHALCDIVTEYGMLTASVCQIPHQLMEILPATSYSTPSSPLMAHKETDLQRRHSILMKKVPEKLALSSTVSSPLLQSLKDAFMKVSSPTPDQAKTFDIPSVPSPAPLGQPSPSPSVQSSTGSESDVQHLIHKYEEGSRGILNPIFSSLLINWFDFCHKLGVPSISKETMTLASRFAIDYFLKEFLSVITNILGDVRPRVFKLYQDQDGNLCNGTLYSPCRNPVQTEDSILESSVDTDRFDLVMAGQDVNFVVVGRNTEQWQASVQDFNEEEFSASPTSPKAIPKQTYQRFLPLLSGRDQSPELMNLMSSPDPVFIPRQRLLLLTIKNTELTLYAYNVAGDLNKLLTNSVMQLMKWNNNRNKLLNSIISQKMGLFHHHPFTQHPKTKNSDLDNLIRHAAPPPQEHLRRKNSNLSNFTGNQPSRPFDDAFRDTQPSKPLSQSSHASIRDVVKRHGLQTQEVRNHVKQDLETIFTLNKLFWSWFAKSSSNEPIYEEDLQLLKQSCRLLHYCATPILFSAIWRHKVMEKYRSAQKLPSSPTPDKADKSRSRHSSGTSVQSMRTKRTDSNEGKKKPESTPTDSPVHGQKQKGSQEEAWHVEIRSDFVGEYMAYVKSIGFVPISVTVNPKKNVRHNKPSSADKNVPEDSLKHCSLGKVYHLHKVMSGGIMMMELSFREQYFCVKYYVCESYRIGMPVNKHLMSMFIDESERCKNLIHIHSFAHDFHLRSIQSYISGQSRYKNSYHLTGFLSDFSVVYPYPPAFSRNFLLTEYITFAELSSPAQTLYEHMTRHIKDHGMKIVAMTPTVDADIDSEYYFVRTTEYALTLCKEYKVPINRQTSEDFNICLVITNLSQNSVYQSEAEKYTLKLQYFIVLTSQRDLFPVDILEKKLGQFKSVSSTDVSSDSTPKISNPVPVKQHIGVRKESRRMKINQHQELAESILIEESTKAREKMNELIRRSMAECRKDSLWNRMLIASHVEDDTRKKKRSDTEDSKDEFHQKLSHEEFLELLQMVVKTPLSEIDPQLLPFQNMSVVWYKSLYKVLQTRYPERHRCFSSPDASVQYLVVITPQFPDMVMMLMIDNKDKKTELCAIFREALEDESEQIGKHSLPFINVQDQQTDFINLCCYHLWASLL